MPRLSAEDIQHILFPVLKYYPKRDWGVIADRVEACILLRKKFLRREEAVIILQNERFLCIINPFV